MKAHRRNCSWTELDHSDLPKGRRLVKMTWAYKTKRNGTLKARLCVQGCSQTPGVDFDQTHCSTLRPTSLRTLAALSADLGLRMRRWDFTSAYLQGSLLDGEVVYCSAPQDTNLRMRMGTPDLEATVAPVFSELRNPSMAWPKQGADGSGRCSHGSKMWVFVSSRQTRASLFNMSPTGFAAMGAFETSG